jgi:hypothetical protein
MVLAKLGRIAPRECGVTFETRATSLRGAKRRSNPSFFPVVLWIASRSLSSGAHSRDPVARNDDTSSAVIVRESGRSSIPETLMIESRGRGVLDRPVKPDDDGLL